VSQALRPGAYSLVSRASYHVEAALDRAFERALCVRTGREVGLAEFEVEAEEGRVWYSPADWVSTWVAIRRLSPSAGDTFLDVGAGLGRVLLVAARFPFRRVLGVEVSSRLAEAARANVERLPCERRDRIEIVVGDAAALPVPTDVTVLYTFNAVNGELFERLLDHVARSLAERPRPLHFVYAYPVEHERVLAAGGRLIDVVAGHFPPYHAPVYPIATYSLGPAGPPPSLPRLSRPRRVRSWQPLRTGTPPRPS
jgi:SAM-dependent methyltransferase